jgi:plastocyanin
MKRAILALMAIVAVLGLAACGGDDDDEETGGGNGGAAATNGGGGGGGGGAGETLKLTADPEGNLSWEPTELSANAGPVTIELDNPSPVPHNVAVEGNGVDEVSDTVSDSTTSVTADLQAGEYTYYCDVPGHRDAGMEGTLTVE